MNLCISFVDSRVQSMLNIPIQDGVGLDLGDDERNKMHARCSCVP